MTRWWGVAGNPKPTIAETDLRVGGRFRVQYWGTNDEHHSVSGTYREVVPNRKLAFSWAWQYLTYHRGARLITGVRSLPKNR